MEVDENDSSIEGPETLDVLPEEDRGDPKEGGGPNWDKARSFLGDDAYLAQEVLLLLKSLKKLPEGMKKIPVVYDTRFGIV